MIAAGRLTSIRRGRETELPRGKSRISDHENDVVRHEEPASLGNGQMDTDKVDRLIEEQAGQARGKNVGNWIN